MLAKAAHKGGCSVLVTLVLAGLLSVVGMTIQQAPVSAAVKGFCSQWRDEALNAGWTAAEYTVLGSIIFRESGCKPGAYNGKGRDRSYGLTQINIKGKLWNNVKRICGISNPKYLFNPLVNLKCAEKLHNSSGWRPWRT